MAAYRALFAVVLLGMLALAAGVSRKECFDAYDAQIKKNVRTGYYKNYAQLAEEYSKCLNSATSDGWAGRKLQEASSRVQADCTEAWKKARRNAEAAGDQTAVKNLDRAYQRCVKGGK